MTSTTVTLLASCYPLARERVLARLRVEAPDVAIVRHELATLATDGCVHRVVDGPDGPSDTAIGVEASCCVSCLLRDDSLAALDGLAAAGVEQVVLVLPTIVEPEAAAGVIATHRGVRLGSVAVVVDGGQLEADLSAPDPLSGHGASDEEDPRSRAEVLARQLESADAVIHAPTDARAAALVAALAPRATLLLETAPTRWWRCPDPRGRDPRPDPAPGVPRPRRAVARAGVVTARWARRRPLHPARLIDAFETGALPGLVRARGHLWVASRPGTLLGLEATPAAVELGAAGAWLDALGQQPHLDAARRRQADATWHPYWGDRSSDLVLVLVDHPADEALAALDRCLLSDEELALGEDGWQRLPDPLDGLGAEADHLDALTRQETP